MSDKASGDAAELYIHLLNIFIAYPSLTDSGLT